MKQILCAEIRQVLEFDSIKEMYLYLGKLQKNHVRYKCEDHLQLDNGHVRLYIVKGYNNSPMFFEEDDHGTKE